MQLALIGSTFIMGLLGSWHCGVMCGPLSCNFRKKEEFLTYHFGRLCSYLILAGVLFFGTQFFVNVESRFLKLLVSILFGVMFVYFGLIQLNVFKNNKFNFKYYKLQFKLLSKSKKWTNKFPVILGLLTGLFPCGWLYSFLLLSAQMKSLPQSLLLVFIFWLTSLPAFFVFTGFMQNLIKNSPVRYQTLSGLVLIAAGVLSILGHWAELVFQ